MPGELRGLRRDLGLLRRLEMILVEFLTGGGADPVEPLVVSDGVATQGALLILLELLLLVGLPR